jgi:predicted metal-binding protein
MKPSRSRKAAKVRARPPARSFLKRAVALGAISAKLIAPKTVITAPWVRFKCRYGCDGWGSSLCCPPHSPTPGETRAVLDSYRRAVLFEAPRGRVTKIAVALEREVFLSGYHKAFAFGAGPCFLCKTCAFEKGCRHTDDARPCMESSGIDVYGTVRRHGFTIEVVRTRQDPQHYFGMVLVE